MVAIVPGSCESRSVVERSAVWMARAVREREVSAVELFEAHAAPHRRARPADQRARAPPARGGPRGGGRGRRGARARRGASARCTACRSPPRTRSRVAGMRAPNGSRLLADHVSEHDAEVIRRMRGAGAILLGKTNVSEFSAWWDSVNPLFGATANPHDHSRTAGGSSGGEAAALASGMSPLGLGSDLGGSIRNPCHFVGVFGLQAGPRHGAVRRARAAAGGPGDPADGRRRPDGALRRGPRARARRARRADVCRRSGRRASRSTRRTGSSPSAVTAAPRCAAPPRRSPTPATSSPRPPRRTRPRCGRRSTCCWRASCSPALPAFVAGREEELSPYSREMVAAARGFVPDWAAYLAASGRLARLEVEADRWLEAPSRRAVPGGARGRAAAGRRLVGRDRRRARRAPAAS